MRVGNNGEPPKGVVTLYGVSIQWKSQIKHLGNTISCDLNDTHNNKIKTNVFISQVNILNSKFSGVSSNVRGKLL